MTKLQREADDRKRRLANTLLMEVLVDLRPQTTEQDLVALLDDDRPMLIVSGGRGYVFEPTPAVRSRTPWKE